MVTTQGVTRASVVGTVRGALDSIKTIQHLSTFGLFPQLIISTSSALQYIVVSANKNDIKVVLSLEKVGKPWFRRKIFFSFYDVYPHCISCDAVANK